MTYGYIRVSTDKQTVENQRFEIKTFCKRERLIKELMAEGVRQWQIAKICKVDRNTLRRYQVAVISKME